MSKTFYSVKYAVMGNGHSTMWFDNYEEAKRFSERDYHDLPEKHTYRSPITIGKIEKLIEMQNEFFSA